MDRGKKEKVLGGRKIVNTTRGNLELHIFRKVLPRCGGRRGGGYLKDILLVRYERFTECLFYQRRTDNTIIRVRENFNFSTIPRAGRFPFPLLL